MRHESWLCSVLSAAATTVWCLSSAATAQPAPPKTLDDIFAPVVVGTPPVDAFNGLFRCPDGEIRHYGDDGFLFSRDDGLTWKHRRFGEVDASGMAASGGRPLGMNAKTGTCLRLVGGNGGMFVHRSTDGPDGKYTVQKIDDRSLGMARPPYFLQSRPRVLFAAHGERPERITVFRSDDDGLTWAKTTLPPGPAFVVEPPHKGPRWENWCVEPTIQELRDGRLWMLARTSRDKAHGILVKCAEKFGGVVYPPVYFHNGFKLEHLVPVLMDLFNRLKRTGYRVIIGVSGHNVQGQIDMINKALEPVTADGTVAGIGLWEITLSRGPESGTDHAAKWETSNMMFLYPDLVSMTELGDGPINLDMKPPSGIGGMDPRQHASAEAGRRNVELAAEAIGRTAQELLASLPEGQRSFNLEALRPGRWWLV